MESTSECTEHYFEQIKTPILLPPDYKILEVKGQKIRYIKPDGSTVESDLYMHHSEQLVIVDEFRKKFPHDSVIVLLFGPNKELYLQKRGQHVRWEPGKVDLASIAGQRRAMLVQDRFEPVDLDENALNTMQKETGIKREKLVKAGLHPLGTHFNSTTNEFQTVYAYQVDADIDTINQLLTTIEDQGELWLAQDYQKTLEEYFGGGVTTYAGGESLRPLNFISNPDIKQTLETYVAGLGRV
jgi:hypothetical protein